jgi:hypothetical protein
MKALLCMVVDCGAKRLKVTTCTAAAAAMFDIGRTGLSIDRRQFFVTQKIIEPFNPRLDLELIARLTDVGQIDRQHIGTVDFLDVLPSAFGLILSGDVAG